MNLVLSACGLLKLLHLRGRGGAGLTHTYPVHSRNITQAHPETIPPPIRSQAFGKYLPSDLWKEAIPDAARIESEFEPCGLYGRS